MPKRTMIDVDPVVRHWSKHRWRGHFKTYRTASRLRKKAVRLTDAKGGMNLKLHVDCDSKDRAIQM